MVRDERLTTYIRSLEGPEDPVLEQIEQEAADTYVPIIRKETQSFLKTLLMIKQPSRVLEIGTAIGFSAILMSEYMPEGALIATIEKVPMRLCPAKENLGSAPRAERIALLAGDAAEVLAELADGKVPAKRGGWFSEEQAADSEVRAEGRSFPGNPDGQEPEAARGMSGDFSGKPAGLQEIYLPAAERSAWLGQSFSEPYDFIFLDAAKGQYMKFLPYLLRLLRKDGIFVTDNVLQEGSIADSKFTILRRDRTIHKRMREYLYELTHRADLNTAVLPVGDGMAVTTFRS